MRRLTSRAAPTASARRPVFRIMMIKMERIEIGDSKGSSILGDLKKQQRCRRRGAKAATSEGGADALPDDEDEEAAAKRASADDPLAGLSEQELADHREIFGSSTPTARARSTAASSSG